MALLIFIIMVIYYLNKDAWGQKRERDNNYRRAKYDPAATYSWNGETRLCVNNRKVYSYGDYDIRDRKTGEIICNGKAANVKSRFTYGVELAKTNGYKYFKLMDGDLEYIKPYIKMECHQRKNIDIPQYTFKLYVGAYDLKLYIAPSFSIFSKYGIKSEHLLIDYDTLELIPYANKKDIDGTFHNTGYEISKETFEKVKEWYYEKKKTMFNSDFYEFLKNNDLYVHINE